MDVRTVIAKETGYYGGIIRNAGETAFQWILKEGESLPAWVEEEAAKIARRATRSGTAPKAAAPATAGEPATPEAPAPEEPEPEAPAPATTGDEINAATGGTAPDWVAPATPAADASQGPATPEAI